MQLNSTQLSLNPKLAEVSYMDPLLQFNLFWSKLSISSCDGKSFIITSAQVIFWFTSSPPLFQCFNLIILPWWCIQRSTLNMVKPSQTTLLNISSMEATLPLPWISVSNYPSQHSHLSFILWKSRSFTI